MAWIEFNLADAMLWDETVYVDGRISGVKTAGNPYGWADFALPTMRVEEGTYYEIQVEYALHEDGYLPPAVPFSNYPQVNASSLNDDEDPFNSSYWYSLGWVDLRTQDTGTATMFVGPYNSDFNLAMGQNEHRVVLSGNVHFTAVRYRVFFAPPNDRLRFGPQVNLDVTPTWDGGTARQFNNFYPTGAKIFDDVLLVAWSCEGYQTGPPYPFWEARAMRWVDQDVAPELGPVAYGPPAPFSDSSLNWVAAIPSAPGCAVIQQGDEYNDGAGGFGWLVSVDPDTLEVTYLQTIMPEPIAPGDYFSTHNWSWKPAPGLNDERVLLQSQGGTPGTGYRRDRLLISITGDSADNLVVRQRRYYSWHPDGTPDSGWFNWNIVSTIVDMGEYWVAFTLEDLADYGGTGNFNIIGVYRIPDDGGFPAEHPTQAVRMGDWIQRGTGWDHDSVHALRMGNGKIYVAESSYNASRNANCWVLDPETWTMTGPVDIGTTVVSGNAAHLQDYLSLYPIDDTRALVGWQPFREAERTLAGTMVAVFDGTRVYDHRPLHVWYNEFTPYTDKDLYGGYGFEAYHVGPVGSGHVIGVGAMSDDEVGTPPYDYYVTRVVAGIVGAPAGFMRGGFRESRRAFSAT